MQEIGIELGRLHGAKTALLIMHFELHITNLAKLHLLMDMQSGKWIALAMLAAVVNSNCISY